MAGIDTFLVNFCVLYNCRLKGNRIKVNPDFTEQKIKLRRAHAEAMMKRLVVLMVTEFTFLFDTLTKMSFIQKTMLSVNASAPFS